MLHKILSVQNIPCETLGLLEQMFVHDGYHIEKLNIQDDPVPTSPSGYDAIVILGGPMAVYDNLSIFAKRARAHQECNEERHASIGRMPWFTAHCAGCGRTSLQGQEERDRMATMCT